MSTPTIFGACRGKPMCSPQNPLQSGYFLFALKLAVSGSCITELREGQLVWVYPDGRSELVIS